MRKTKNTITQFVTVSQAREIVEALLAAIEEFKDDDPSAVRLINPDALEPDILIVIDQS